MKIGVTSNTFMLYPVEKTLEVAGKLGCRGIMMMSDRPHLHPDDYIGKTKKVLDLAKSCGVEIYGLDPIHAPCLNDLAAKHKPSPDMKARWNNIFRHGVEPYFTSNEEYLRRLRIDFTKRCIDLGAELGVKVVQVATGRTLSDPDDADAWVKAGWKELYDHALSRNITLATEMAEDQYVSKPDEALEMLKAIGAAPEHFGMVMDIGHMWVQRLDVPAQIRKLGKERIKVVHIEDMKRYKHFHLPIGEGSIDLLAALNALKEIGYEGYLMIEMYNFYDDPEPAMTRCVANLKRLLDKAGIAY
jgi:sugar phosphate isomerase/epimerase